MPTILLIRHGQNEYVKKGKLAGRLPGVHLDEVGVKQSEALAKHLADTPIKAFYSSPLERAMETAKPIAKSHGIKIIKKAGLLELDIGSWEGKSIRQVARTKLWKVVQHNPSRAQFPGGETFAEAQLRIVNEIELIVQKHKGKDIVCCVGHSDMIKLALAYYLGQPLDHFQRIIVSPASISTIHLGKSGAQIYNINQIIDFKKYG